MSLVLWLNVRLALRLALLVTLQVLPLPLVLVEEPFRRLRSLYGLLSFRLSSQL